MMNLFASTSDGFARKSSRCSRRSKTPRGCDNHCGSFKDLVLTATRAVPSSSFSSRGPARYLFLYSNVIKYCTASSL